MPELGEKWADENFVSCCLYIPNDAFSFIPKLLFLLLQNHIYFFLKAVATVLAKERLNYAVPVMEIGWVGHIITELQLQLI